MNILRIASSGIQTGLKLAGDVKQTAVKANLNWWQSMLGIGYFVQSSGNLNSPMAFTTVATNLAGQSGATVFVDTNSPGTAPRFYRVGAQ